MSDFTEITSDNRWFTKHPEKIAGVEFESTSFFFPIQIKGTKEDVLRVTGMMTKDNNKLKLARSRAKAILIQLQLNQ